MRVKTSLVATLAMLLPGLPILVPAGAAVGAAVVLSGCEDNRAKKTTSKRYDPKLPANHSICLVTDHLDTNNKSDPDHSVNEHRQGRWQTSGRAPDCVVQVKDRGKTADGKEPGWHTVARGEGKTFYLVADKHAKFRVLDCGPRGYHITAGYGVFKIKCQTNAQWGADGKSCKDHKDCT